MQRLEPTTGSSAEEESSPGVVGGGKVDDSEDAASGGKGDDSEDEDEDDSEDEDAARHRHHMGRAVRTLLANDRQRQMCTGSVSMRRPGQLADRRTTSLRGAPPNAARLHSPRSAILTTSSMSLHGSAASTRGIPIPNRQAVFGFDGTNAALLRSVSVVSLKNR